MGTGAEEKLAYQLRATQTTYKREFKIPLHGSEGLDYAKVDFLVESRLVVEVDGASHSDREQQQLDAKKDKALKRLGYQVIRVRNISVMRGRAITRIQSALRDDGRKRKANTPQSAKKESEVDKGDLEAFKRQLSKS